MEANAHFSSEQLAAINSLIDSKVEERLKKFQEDYDELMNKVKSKISSAIKPASLLGKAGFGAKPKDADANAEESKDTTPTASATHTPSQSTARMSLTGNKRPTTGSALQKPTPSRRSDSKESTKNGAGADKSVDNTNKQAAEERKKELLEKKRQEEERKKEDARLKKEELERKKKEEADKKKQAEEERKKKQQEDRVAAEKKKLEATMPKPAGKAGTAAGGLLPEDEDDPISKSLNERIKAGGVTQQVVKAGGAKPAAISQPGLKKPLPSTKESTTDTKPAAGDKSKPTIGGGSQAAAQKDAGAAKGTAAAADKGLLKQVSSVADKKGKGAADDEDPIEKSLLIRIKAGGVTQVIS